MKIANIIIVAIASPIFFYIAFMFAFPTFIGLKEIWLTPNPLWGRLIATLLALMYFSAGLFFLIGAVFEFGLEGFIGMIIGGIILFFWIKRI
jgi:hypothetical protein